MSIITTSTHEGSPTRLVLCCHMASKESTKPRSMRDNEREDVVTSGYPGDSTLSETMRVLVYLCVVRPAGRSYPSLA